MGEQEISNVSIAMKILLSICHGGSKIPEEHLNEYLPPIDRFGKHEDRGSIEIFSFAEYPCISTEISRFLVDLNRRRADASEMGVILQKDWDDVPVLKKTLSSSERETRLRKYFDPFYEKFDSLVGKGVFVLDGHSMGSETNTAEKEKLAKGKLKKIEERPDICVAVQEKYCDQKIIDLFIREFSNKGFSVKVNNPYSTGDLIERAYLAGSQGVMLEINKKLYMNEKTLELDLKRIRNIRRILKKILNKIESF